MAKAMELNIKGIKCDNCDYKNMGVKFEEYDQWLNKPCPKCGANLLTQEDVDSMDMLIQIAEMTNEIFPDGFDGDDSKGEEFNKRIKGVVNMDGSGKVDISLSDADD
ncbi:hypothetical protein ACFSMW_06710 [Virgibacillus halophilus]|uniref:Uncharacterized protein n=1 Tax=Tigheibacillus halophilus TaxID=361280 RepID=A0ABU5C7D7_9BACI|nr:hypothetical protein [Virgibacillus halophilus]